MNHQMEVIPLEQQKKKRFMMGSRARDEGSRGMPEMSPWVHCYQSMAQQLYDNERGVEPVYNKHLMEPAASDATMDLTSIENTTGGLDNPGLRGSVSVENNEPVRNNTGTGNDTSMHDLDRFFNLGGEPKTNFDDSLNCMNSINESMTDDFVFETFKEVPGRYNRPGMMADLQTIQQRENADRQLQGLEQQQEAANQQMASGQHLHQNGKISLFITPEKHPVCKLRCRASGVFTETLESVSRIASP